MRLARFAYTDVLRIESELPICAYSKTERWLPIRCKPLTDRADAMHVESRTENMFAQRAKLRSENAEPDGW